ncbi:hypothetical protein B0H13DRAFT_2337075 [Mycena leptocephala]|nr:hypothetical protein B0H13DRAFT_2337075 [Mycena leptocephala]
MSLALAKFHPEAAADALWAIPWIGSVAPGSPLDQPRPFDPIAGFEPGSWTVGEDDYRPGEVSAANRELIDDDDSQERWRPVGEIPYIGWTSLLVDADDLVFDSGYHIKIEYHILPHLHRESGRCTVATLKTLPDGSFHITQRFEPLVRGVLFSEPLLLPEIPLSSLQPMLRHAAVLLVKTPLDPPTDRSVLKIMSSHTEWEPRAPDDDTSIRFLARLPDVDFLLRPTHVVVGEDGRARGILLPHQPASSLALTLGRLHPGAVPPTLPPFAGDCSGFSLPATPASIPWLVKLGWLTDIAAGVAWLHTQSLWGCDLKLENIVVCRDGHCRLIDYMPGAFTVIGVHRRRGRSTSLSSAVRETCLP